MTIPPTALAAAILPLAFTHAAAQSSFRPVRTGATAPAPPVAPALGAAYQAGSSCPGQELYLCTNLGTIYRVDDYATSPSPVLVTDTGLNGILDIAVDPATGKLYGLEFFGSSTGLDVIEIDIATGGATVVGMMPGFTNSLDFGSDGFMYGRDDTGVTYRIQLSPFSATPVNSFIGVATAGDAAWDVDGTLLMTTTNGFIERFDLATGGTPLFDTLLGSNAFGIEVDCGGTVYVAEDSGEWYTADLVAGTLSLVGNLGITESVYGIAFSETPGGGTLGATYCNPAVPNSSGVPGVITALGSAVVAVNDLQLNASSLPPASFGFFLTSLTQGLAMNPGGSQGTLCLGGSIGRYVGPGQILNSQGAGEFQLAIDLTLIPQPAGFVSVMAGEAWNFQAWHRDSVAGMPTSNFTDAVTITFI